MSNLYYFYDKISYRYTRPPVHQERMKIFRMGALGIFPYFLDFLQRNGKQNFLQIWGYLS